MEAMATDLETMGEVTRETREEVTQEQEIWDLTITCYQGAGNQGMNQAGSHQGGQSGFQNNPKQVSQGQYHVFTTSSCRRDKKLQRGAVNVVVPAVRR